MADSPDLRLPPDADPDEAAAIVAAVEWLLAEEARAAGDGEVDGEDPWAGRRFSFAGRLSKVTGDPVRVPHGAPADPWAAAGRMERW